MSETPPDRPEDRNDLPSLAIRRPMLVLVMNLLIIILGISAFMGVEVRELPDVDRPIISVNATYPGASPETMDAEVTRIVEGAVARVNGIKQIRSSSEENNMRIRAEFSPSIDLDTAASDVREAVGRIQRELPDDVEQLTIYKADQDASPIMRLAASSPTLTEDELTRVIETDIVSELISIEGVADVPLFGGRERQLRVVMDPLRLTSYGLSVADVADVLRTAPFDIPTGSFRSRDQELLVRVDASTVTEQAVEDLIIRDDIRLGDVARVFFGPADAETFTRLDGVPVIGMGIVRQAESNTVAISSEVQRVIERLSRRLDEVNIRVISDDAIFIRGSIREVLISLSLTVMIVVSAIWLFLGSLRATLIPSVTIPVALIGTLAGIWLLGFSINILTLLALLLATGLIVDDAIVVLENIQRRRAQGLKAGAASVLGTQQVFFAVIATTAVLISVFVPISFLPSTAGRLFTEFGFVLAVAVAISSFVALSLVPSMAAYLLPENGQGSGSTRVAGFGQRLQESYRRAIHVCLDRPWTVTAVSIAAAGLASLLYIVLPQELLPDEDRGQVNIFFTGPDGVGLGYVDRQVLEIERIIEPYQEAGVIDTVFSIVGRYDPNRAGLTMPLVPWGERDMSQQELVAELQAKVANVPGGRVSVSSPNSLSLGDAGDELEIGLTGNEYTEIYEAAKEFARLIEDRVDYLSDADLSYQPTQPQLSVEVDRRRAADLGLSLDDLEQTLQAVIGGDDLIDLSVGDEAIPIILEVSTRDIDDPSDLVNLYITTDDGDLVSLSSIVSIREEGVAAELDRHVQRRAVEIDLRVRPGVPLAQAVDDVRALDDQLPPGIGLIMLGEARELEETSSELLIVYGIAVAIVFLVLVAQFESWTSALVVIATVPFGLAAAIFVLFVTGVSLNIYSQIGLVMLIGLMAKNGVLLVEFADQLRDAGHDVREAVEKAAMVRLRPIAMTMTSTVMGSLPLVLAFGPGSEARSAIGWVVFGGVGIAAVFTLFFTPIVYLGLARFSKPRASASATLADELNHSRGIADDAY